MIGELEGKPKLGADGRIIILTSGVGYSVNIAPNKMGAVLQQKNIHLYIHTHSTDKEISLFGFMTKEEYGLFQKLISISGIGPRTALTIMAKGKAEDLSSAIAGKNIDLLVSGFGISKRQGEKLILELSEKLGEIKNDNGTTKEVLDALFALGYDAKTAQLAARFAGEKGGRAEEQVAAALEYISGGISN